MKGTICQVKSSKATGPLQKKKRKRYSSITMISSLKTSVIWRTPVKTQMSAKMETNKQKDGRL